MTNRDQKGRYARRSKLKIILVIAVVVAVIAALNLIDTTTTYTRIETATSTPEVATSTNPLDEIKARENFKKRVENQAKQVFINEEIEDREAQIAALKAEIATLQTDLETTRQEELDLQ